MDRTIMPGSRNRTESGGNRTECGRKMEGMGFENSRNDLIVFEINGCDNV